MGSPIGQAGMAGIASPIDSPGDIPKGKDSAKMGDAAQQFEALLLGQILHSAHDSESGWLGSGGDSSSDCATDYAEQQLAATMAKQGGLGLAKMITAGLEREASR
jgi:Rod binding domain-containing protein